MKSIKMKLIVSILTCSLLTAVLIGVLAISDSMKTAGNDAVAKMQLTGMKKAGEINSVIQKIEQSVDTMSEVAMSGFDYEKFVKSKEYADSYTDKVEKTVLNFANHTNGAVTVYLRYNPKYSNPTSGIFAQRSSLDSDLECLTPTDFSMYEEGDMEHVGWYYLPVQAGKAIWMSPYMNENVNIYMISYVVPLFAEDGTSIGVIGMDIDFSQITDLVDETKIYQSGYAFLMDADGAITYHKQADNGTVITDMDPSLAKATEIITDDDKQGIAMQYSYQGTKKQLLYNNLDNGMKFVLTAPEDEIYGEAYSLVRMILAAMLIAVVIATVIGTIMGTRMANPIRQLTAIIDQTAQLDFSPTENGGKLRRQKDEIGVMAKQIHKMRKTLCGLMEDLQQT